MELFTTFNKQGEPAGIVPRDQVHRSGLWHKSVQVFIFNSAGQLLMQRRAVDKDLYAGLWDYSVGEHLLPSEQDLAGALRGLKEELGIAELALEPLGTQRWVEQSGPGFLDREIQQAFSGIYDGAIVADPVEVAQTQFIDLGELSVWIERRPEDFTPWFVEDLVLFEFLLG